MEQGLSTNEKQRLFDKYVDMNKLDTALQKFYEDTIVQKGEGKYKCGLCGKLFKDTVFVKKHISNKHDQELVAVEGKMSEEMMYQLYSHDDDRPIDATGGTASGIPPLNISTSGHFEDRGARSPARARSRERGERSGASGKVDIFGRALREEDDVHHDDRSPSPSQQRDRSRSRSPHTIFTILYPSTYYTSWAY